MECSECTVEIRSTNCRCLAQFVLNRRRIDRRLGEFWVSLVGIETADWSEFRRLGLVSTARRL